MLHRYSNEREQDAEPTADQIFQPPVPVQESTNSGVAAHAGAVRQLRAEPGARQDKEPAADSEAHSCGAGCGHRELASAPAPAGGAALPGPVQAKMEGSFGADFGNVRVSETKAASDVGALAYTQGENISFAPGQYDPGSRSGQELIGHELTHVVQQRSGRVGGAQAKGAPINADTGLEQEADTMGSRAAQGLPATVAGAAPDSAIQRKEGTSPEIEQGAKEKEAEEGDKKFSLGEKVKSFFSVGKVITVGTEKVKVYDESEELEAPLLIAEIKDKYGIEISSLSTVQAIKKHYGKVPDEVKDKVVTKEWEFKEIKAISNALKHYAPILGDKRKNSSRKGEDQEVLSIGKVKNAIDKNTADGELDDTTLGEYFKADKNFAMTKAGTNSKVDFKDNLKQLEATAVHEMAHGLMAHEYNNFVAKGSDGFWLDQNTKSGTDNAEAPPSDYGNKNAREDLCESVMFYFVAEATLLKKCPKRHAWIAKVVASWTAKDENQDQDQNVKEPVKGGCNG